MFQGLHLSIEIEAEILLIVLKAHLRVLTQLIL